MSKRKKKNTRHKTPVQFPTKLTPPPQNNPLRKAEWFLFGAKFLVWAAPYGSKIYKWLEEHTHIF